MTPSSAACRADHRPGWTTSTKIAVNAASPTSQPARKAKPVGLGRGVCNTSTAGMIDNGDSATTSASGMSSVSTDPQLPDITALPSHLEENVASGRPPWWRYLPLSRLNMTGESIADLPSYTWPG